MCMLKGKKEEVCYEAASFGGTKGCWIYHIWLCLGEVKGNRFQLLDGQGKHLPVQSRVLAWWPDGSIKWSAHTADAAEMTTFAEVLPGGVRRKSDGESPEDNCETGKDRCAYTEGMYVGRDGEVLQITEEGQAYSINTGRLQLQIGKQAGSPFLAEQIRIDGVLLARAVYPVFMIEHRGCSGETESGHEMPLSGAERSQTYALSAEVRKTLEYRGEITSVELEEAGPLQAVFCFRGKHVQEQPSGAQMPFVIRMYLWAGSEEIRFQHTFLYDGAEEQDFLKGMGIRVEMCMGGPLYDRHVQFGTDKVHFHEAAVILSSSHPRVGGAVLERQMAGEFVDYEKKDPGNGMSAGMAGESPLKMQGRLQNGTESAKM